MKVSFDELLKEIRRLDTEKPEGFTSDEMSLQTGRSRKWCRAQICKLKEAGKVVFNGRVKRESIDGRSCYIPVYKVIK